MSDIIAGTISVYTGRGWRQSWSGMWYRGLGGELGWGAYLDHRESRAHGCGSPRACSTARQSGPDRADNIGRVESSRDNVIAQRPETVEEGPFGEMHFQQGVSLSHYVIQA
jgi:hypothetical protein